MNAPTHALRPLPVSGPDDHVVAALAEPGVAILDGPPGSYVAERLAGVIANWGRWRHCVWWRAGNVPLAELCAALAEAGVRRWEDSSAPGTDSDVDGGLRRAPAGAVVVLELPRDTSAAVVRWISSARPLARRRGLSLVAVTEHSNPAVTWSGLDDAVHHWAVGPPVGPEPLPAGRCRRLVELAGPRAAVVRDVVDAARVWSPEPVARALDSGHELGTVLDVLTEELHARCSAEQQAALRISALTGYWHPSLAPYPVDAAGLRPWIVPLEDGWGWVRPLWRRALRRVLGDDPAGRSRSAVTQRRTTTPTPVPPSPDPAGDRPAILLEARLLGPFEVRVDGRAVSRWRGRLGPDLLRFLLARPGHVCARDELLAEFWPETAPDVARNRLQVVVSGLRRALGELAGTPVLEYVDGGYRIAADVRVETDTARFEEALEVAREAERAGDTARAAGAYQEMLDLYRGDFAVDSPSDSWTLLPRESLRIGYLDALDRLSRIHLDAGRLDDAISVGHRMVEADVCREDAHRLIIFCYARQGRSYQALRQFDFCVRVLRSQLDVGPQPSTLDLVRSIRDGARVPALTE
ncbi:AfsR/SARP family transcriptional regulator [Actinomycetospora sp. C-140]